MTSKTQASPNCTCTYSLYGQPLSPETKWKAKQDPCLMTALLLFSPGGITTLIVAFLGDFEVPLLLIAELVSFGEFENSLFSSFPTVKCYMLTFYSAHYEFRDTEMTDISLQTLLCFSQLKNAYSNPATATLPGDIYQRNYALWSQTPAPPVAASLPPDMAQLLGRLLQTLHSCVVPRARRSREQAGGRCLELLSLCRICHRAKHGLGHDSWCGIPGAGMCVFC